DEQSECRELGDEERSSLDQELQALLWIQICDCPDDFCVMGQSKGVSSTPLLSGAEDVAVHRGMDNEQTPGIPAGEVAPGNSLGARDRCARPSPHERDERWAQAGRRPRLVYV